MTLGQIFIHDKMYTTSARAFYELGFKNTARKKVKPRAPFWGVWILGQPLVGAELLVRKRQEKLSAVFAKPFSPGFLWVICCWFFRRVFVRELHL